MYIRTVTHWLNLEVVNVYMQIVIELTAQLSALNVFVVTCTDHYVICSESVCCTIMMYSIPGMNY